MTDVERLDPERLDVERLDIAAVGDCIRCGGETTTLEHVCSACTPRLLARRRLAELDDGGLAAVAAKTGGPTVQGAQLPTISGIAVEVGTSRRTVTRALDEELASRGLTPRLQAAKVARIALSRKRRDEDTASAIAAAAVSDVRHRYETCPVADLPDLLGPGSVDVVLTDPPYEAGSEGLYRDLGTAAGLLLRPGGTLAVLMGCGMFHTQFTALNEAARAAELEWCGLDMYRMPGASTMVRPTRQHVTSKPVAVYYRPPHHDRWRDNTIAAPARRAQEQTAGHPWEQQAAGMGLLVDRYALPGQTVADPFCGGGTIPLAAAMHGCLTIASDVDPDWVDVTRARLTDQQPTESDTP